MHVPVLKMCRHAAQLVDGTMMLTSIIRRIRPGSFPSPFPPVLLVIEIEWDPVDIDEELTTRIVDEDGRIVWQAPLDAKARPAQAGTTVSDWLVLNMAGTCTIPGPGDYLVELRKEDQLLNWTRVRFDVQT